MFEPLNVPDFNVIINGQNMSFMFSQHCALHTFSCDMFEPKTTVARIDQMPNRVLNAVFMIPINLSINKRFHAVTFVCIGFTIIPILCTNTYLYNKM